MSEDPDLEVVEDPPVKHPCPNCGEAAMVVTVRGPDDCVIGPCGCRVPHVDF